MPDAPLNMLVILQAGVLLGLAAWFLLESLRRKDRVLRLMALAGVLVALAPLLSRWESLRVGNGLDVVGYVLLLQACSWAYPGRLPRRLPWLLLLALLPGLLLPRGGTGVVRGAVTLGQMVAAGVMLRVLWALLRLRQDGECLTRGVLPFFWTANVLLFAHTLAQPYIGAMLGLQDTAMVLLLLALGAAHLKDIGRHLLERAEHLDAEVSAWRSLLGGPSWRTGEPADAMAERFGSRWASPSSGPLLGMDGTPHRLHRATFLDGAEVGWAEPLLSGTQEEVPTFLKGWSVGLGMDEGPTSMDVRTRLESWGASVLPIGTVPPREAPYPNVMIWAREPSILSVWRELDLGRRRCRWVQIGGADMEGPHARLGRDFSEVELRDALRSLVSPGLRAGSGRA